MGSAKWAEIVIAEGDGNCDGCGRTGLEGEQVMSLSDNDFWLCKRCVLDAARLICAGETGDVNRPEPQEVKRPTYD